MTDDTTARAGHAPTPWRFSPWHIEEGPPAVLAPEGWIVCTTSSDGDAAFIVQACNSFDAMRDALKEAERFLDYFAEGRTSFVGAGTPKSCLAQIRAALALANGAS